MSSDIRLTRHSHLSPGGWAEFKDCDIALHPNEGSQLSPVMEQWHRLLIDAFNKIGREPCPGPLLKGLAERAGFINVREHIYRLPLGGWAADKKLVRHKPLTFTLCFKYSSFFYLKLRRQYFNSTFSLHTAPPPPPPPPHPHSRTPPIQHHHVLDETPHANR